MWHCHFTDGVLFCPNMESNLKSEKTGEARVDWILALDLPDRDAALDCLDELGDSLRWVKIGLQLFTRYGPEFVEQVAARGYRIFLDLKLHDIPNTVAKAVESVASLPVELLTLHASGGSEMLRWAVAARNDKSPEMRLLAVTVLTSMDAAGLAELGLQVSPAEQVERLAKLSLAAGVDGLVCSPLELTTLRGVLGRAPLLVTPGIRPAGAASNEQKRIMTPADAIAAGTSYMVIGRPVLAAKDRRAAALALNEELQTLLD
jgi:orotidine-5'-phosphate decarboxylase